MSGLSQDVMTPVWREVCNGLRRKPLSGNEE